MSPTARLAPGILPAIVTAVLLALPGPGVLRAQVQDHGEGFFLRLSAGGGSAATEATDGPSTMRFSGGAGDLNFAIGGIVATDLALHATLFGWTIADPEVEFNGLTGTAGGDLTLGAFGAGVTYYFMPVNIYISGSLGLGRFEYTEGSLDGRSSMGLAIDATVGKEWWVGDSWGLGVALGLGMHSVPDDDVDDDWSGGSVTLRFTATMN